MAIRGGKERQKQKRTLWQRFKGRCAYCEERLRYETATLDHIIPLSKGGTNSIFNRALACMPCNRDKGDKLHGITWTRMAPWETRESLRENGYSYEAETVSL